MRVRATERFVRVRYDQSTIDESTATHVITESVVIQSFGYVDLCFAARSGSTAPGNKGAEGQIQTLTKVFAVVLRE